MKNIVKIIHKFKNNERRTQYLLYIFIGSLQDDQTYKICDLIKKKNFYDTLNSLSRPNIKHLEEKLGEYWYNNFFISKHILDQKNVIIKNPAKKKSIITKFGKEYYQKHIEKKQLQNTQFSFAANYYKLLKNKNKIKSVVRKQDMDFRTYNLQGGSMSSYQFGGDELDDLDKKIEEESEETEKVLTEEVLDEEVEEEFDLDELTNLYSVSTQEDEKNIDKTSDLISAAIKDNKWEDKEEKNMIEIDDKIDNINYDMKIEDLYEKIYIKDNFIFKDDTIKTITQKISASISLNEKFDAYLLPEYQYLYSEYNSNNKSEYVMLGQKWIRRNELLKIDIIPNNNLKIYEGLKNNLAYLKDSFGIKIKREDDEANILRDYDDYSTNNEYYMIDLLNELGINYSSDDVGLKNLYDVFINIYFPKLTYDRFLLIVDLLNGKNDKERDYNDIEFKSLRNDVKLEKEITNTVELAKKDVNKYGNLFEKNNILNSTIHIDLDNKKNITGTISQEKFNLYRIFDNFVMSEMYPFCQYQTPDGQISYKFYNDKRKFEDQTILGKWFENAPYGISFKIKIDENKYVSITLNESGKLEYKITWKEDEKATVDDIKKSFKYIYELIRKINKENKKIKIIEPDESLFKYAFINTILKFNIPEKFKINHNDLSDFARFFFPYVSLVIEPKKRSSANIGKSSDLSKYGTYLRYKRISKFENRIKMHLRILYFFRNFELSDRELVDEVAKQFNITPEEAAKEIDYVKDKYSNAIKKSSKVLKKLQNMPRSKPPGIDVNIQGKDINNYKIRITGSRSKAQLNEIILFMKVLLFLYIETYLYKKPKYQKLKTTLAKLNKVAKRRSKVAEIVDYQSEMKSVKMLISLDKERLGFKPEEGQNQWSRSCQNSGKDKRRQPIPIPGDQLQKLLKMGYKLNKKSGYYEKEVDMIVKGKKHKVSLKAIKLAVPGEPSRFNFYTCDSSAENKHKFIGFLSRGNNPNDLCMPCCFKKDQLVSNNLKKKNYFKKCTGDRDADDKVEEIENKDLGDKLYILQETNKVVEGRFIFLPDDLEKIFNLVWNNTHKIKNHYLTESETGYFFKYTVKDKYYFFLSAIANIFGLTVKEVIDKCVDFLEKDKDNKYYNFLENGEISVRFGDKKNYIDYLKTSTYLEEDIVGELVQLPGVLSNKFIKMYVFEKKITNIKRKLENDEIRINHYLKCSNIENKKYDDDFYIFIIKDKNYYFPIYHVQKTNKDKKINLKKTYKTEEIEKVINTIKNYYTESCIDNVINNLNFNFSLINKNIIEELKKNNIKIKTQYIDSRNKCLYLDTSLGLIPVFLSGTDFNYSIQNKNKIKYNNLKKTIKSLKDINKKINLDYIPLIVYYSENKGDKFNIKSIELKNKLLINVKEEKLSKKEIQKLGLNLQKELLENSVDENILKVNTNFKSKLNVKKNIYFNESYNMFRLELSLFFSKNTTLRNELINLVRNKNIKLSEKKKEIKKLLYNIINSKLAIKYKYSNSKLKSISHITKTVPDLIDYQINNTREYCNTYSKDKCNLSSHCIWNNNQCLLRLTEEYAVDFVNRVYQEIIQDKIAFKELVNEDDYFVSDIVDYSVYSTKPNQKIIKTTNVNVKKILAELFGKDSIPNIGRRRMKNQPEDLEYDTYELIELGSQLVQQIINNEDSIIRAYVNSYYFINNPLYDIESRNLGYNTPLQTKLTQLFKAYIIDFIMTHKDDKEFVNTIGKTFKNSKNFFKSAINKFRKNSVNTNGEAELFVLSYLFKHPIVVFDNYGNVIRIYNKGKVKTDKQNIKTYTNISKLTSTIFIKMDFEEGVKVPNKIYSVYYK